MNWKYPYLHRGMYDHIRKIDKHLTSQPTIKVTTQGVIINNKILVSQRKTMFKMKGVGPWTKYSHKALALAINTNRLSEYFHEMTEKWGDDKQIRKEKIDKKVAFWKECEKRRHLLNIPAIDE